MFDSAGDTDFQKLRVGYSAGDTDFQKLRVDCSQLSPRRLVNLRSYPFNPKKKENEKEKKKKKTAGDIDFSTVSIFFILYYIRAFCFF